MRTPVLFLLILSLCAVPLLAQEKVAEGEYADLKTKSGNIIGRTETKWVLYSSPHGYHLESEISGSPSQPRFVQTAELDQKLVPTAVAYSAYSKDGKSSGTIWCNFEAETITCGARPVQAGENAQSKPFTHHGPFWLWVSNWFALDMDWLMAGAINMAHLEAGKTSIATVTVDGGGDVEWYFDDKEEEPLEFVDIENIGIEGKQISARHYRLGSDEKPSELWMSNGIVVKSTTPSACGGCGDILVHYKQYKKLIPELPVEPASANAGPSK